MERKSSRKRLRPWLEQHLENNTYQGLKWINKGKRMFRISWRHQNNSNWDANADAEIFKGWALHSGKFKQGDPENPPEWKTRLRTALTKLSDVEEMREHHTVNHDTEDPYRVYRFLNEEEVANKKFQQQGSPISDIGISPSPSSSSQTSPTSQIDYLELTGDDAVITKPKTECGNDSNIPTVVLEYDADPCNYDMNNVDIEGMTPGPNQAIYHPPIHLPFNIPYETTGGEAQANIMPDQSSRCPSDLTNIDMEGFEQLELPENSAMSLGSLPSTNSISLSVLKLKVFFMDSIVQDATIESQGARLFCGKLPSIDPKSKQYLDLFGSNSVRQICIRPIESIQDICIGEKQKNMITAIQKNMERGLVLEYKHEKLYVKRLCKARVFAWNSRGDSAHLDRDNSTEKCVFDFNLFKQQLLEFHSSKTPFPPSSSVFFSFGQEYKMDQPSKKNVLLYVEISHIEAEDLLKPLSSNTHEPELLISDANSEDSLASLLKSKLSLEENSNYHSDCIFQGS